ncbi:MAG: hypothetical protein Q7J34_12895 [Bacteroidales bacterium]|nr:hypothetical protein [Bacteroidales bacterium]
MKKALNIFIWVLLAAMLVAGLGYAWKEQEKIQVNEMRIRINHEGSEALISEKEVESVIKKVHKKPIGMKAGKVNVKEIESALGRNPFIADANVFVNLDGIMSVDVMQRIPLARLQNKTGNQAFVDLNGNIFPLSQGHSARVLVISGHIDIPLQTGYNVFNASDSLRSYNSLHTACLIALEIYHHPGLSAMIGQIYMDEKGDAELFTITTNHTIVFGDESNASDKFARLWLFYKRALPANGWNTYRIINLKFENQVVCTK